MILNRYIRNMFRSDHLNESYNSLYISHRGRWGFQPQRFICHLTVIPSYPNCSIEPYYKLAMNFKILCQFEMTGDKYFSSSPTFVLKCANYGVIPVLWKTYTLI